MKQIDVILKKDKNEVELIINNVSLSIVFDRLNIIDENGDLMAVRPY